MNSSQSSTEQEIAELAQSLYEGHVRVVHLNEHTQWAPYKTQLVLQTLLAHAPLKARAAELDAQLAVSQKLCTAYEEAIGDDVGTILALKSSVAELEGALETAESEARRYAEMYPQSSDGRNTFIILADRIAALSHAGPVARDGER
jgi:hypothetical protein